MAGSVMAYKKNDVVDAEAELEKQLQHPYVYSVYWFIKALTWHEFRRALDIAKNTWRIFVIRLRSDIADMLWSVRI
jgi:hypothetical protein